MLFFTDNDEGLFRLRGRTAVKLASTPHAANPLWVAGGHLFWSDGNYLWRRRIDGTDAVRIWSEGAASWGANAITADANYLYFTALGAGIMRAPLAEALEVGEDALKPTVLVPTGEGIEGYFGETSNTEGSLAVNDTHIFWVAFGGNGFSGGESGISRANLDGTGVTRGWKIYDGFEATEPLREMYGLLATSDHVYFSGNYTGTIGRVAADGSGGITTIAGAGENVSYYSALATDGKYLYWTHAKGSGRIGRVLMDGGGEEPEWFFFAETDYTLGLAIAGGITLGAPRFAAIPL